LFQIKDVTAVVIKEAAPSPAGPEINVSPPPASGILNNAAEIP
jgi:hypothetical protein